MPRWPRRRRRRFSEKEKKKKTSHFFLFFFIWLCVCAVVNGGTERGCLHHPVWRDHPHQVPLSTVPPTVFISRLWKEHQWYIFTYGGKSSKIAQQLVKLEKRENLKTPNFYHPQHLESKRFEFDWTSQHEKRRETALFNPFAFLVLFCLFPSLKLLDQRDKFHHWTAAAAAALFINS